MSWNDTLREKIIDLELIASWASQVNLGRVRDAIRHATYELRQELERFKTDGKAAQVSPECTPPDETYSFEQVLQQRQRRQAAEFSVRTPGYEPSSNLPDKHPQQ